MYTVPLSPEPVMIEVRHFSTSTSTKYLKKVSISYFQMIEMGILLGEGGGGESEEQINKC